MRGPDAGPQYPYRRQVFLMITATTDVNLAIFRRYAGLSLPRHVSYPMPTWWQDVDAAQVFFMYERSASRITPNDLSLYVHVPFCENLCKFCACTRIVRRKNSPKAAQKLDAYLDALEREIIHVAQAAGGDRGLRQVHWGGGSPTYLAEHQMERIQRVIQKAFKVSCFTYF